MHLPSPTLFARALLSQMEEGQTFQSHGAQCIVGFRAVKTEAHLRGDCAKATLGFNRGQQLWSTIKINVRYGDQLLLTGIPILQPPDTETELKEAQFETAHAPPLECYRMPFCIIWDVPFSDVMFVAHARGPTFPETWSVEQHRGPSHLVQHLARALRMPTVGWAGLCDHLEVPFTSERSII
ncbi:hypothetical protein FA13DRAFT_1707070 [Coprinellus micaceus]|uniref:Uncharacterized protein n=1 Tax=Coprinellus micaceus TaxID=71717 RepID=A0A4Y7TL01_COPMI|nr:hypothetical protein FA13DRAFT_1707070 [Coprinellus micaceus]